MFGLYKDKHTNRDKLDSIYNITPGEKIIERNGEFYILTENGSFENIELTSEQAVVKEANSLCKVNVCFESSSREYQQVIDAYDVMMSVNDRVNRDQEIQSTIDFLGKENIRHELLSEKNY